MRDEGFTTTELIIAIIIVAIVCLFFASELGVN